MTAELVRRDTDSWVDVLGPVGDLASKLATTDFVPPTLRNKPAAIAACILTGREVGVGPMAALQGIYVVDSRPTLSAELMRSLVFAAGHRIRYIETTTTRCTVEGYRRGEEVPTAKVTYSTDDAKRAGLLNKGNWTKNPRQMLQARATAELCRLAFPDAIQGLAYVPDELEGGRVEDVDTTTGEITPAAPTGRRMARRATRTAEAVREDQPAAEPPQAAPTAVDEPPLDDPPPSAPEPVMGAPTARKVEDRPLPEPKTAAESLAERALAHVGAAETSITKAQSAKLHALFNECEWPDREDRLRAASAIVGRPLTTSNDLTKDEASAVIEALVYAAAADDPQQMLADIVEVGLVGVLEDVVDGEVVE